MLFNQLSKDFQVLFSKMPNSFWRYKTPILLAFQFILFVVAAILFDIRSPQLEVFFALFFIAHLFFTSSRFVVSYLGAAYFASHLNRSTLFLILFSIYSFLGKVEDEALLSILAAFFFIEITFSYAHLIGSRLLLRRRLDEEKKAPILIWGAGFAGKSFISNQETLKNFNVIGFLDDDINKIGSVYGELKVYSRNDFEQLKTRWSNLQVYISAPSLNERSIFEIKSFLKSHKIDAVVLPNYIKGQKQISPKDFVSLDIDELIGRPENNSNQFIHKFNINDIVLVTGGGGSIGLELVNSCLSYGVNELVIAEQSEFNLYKAREFFESNPDFSHVKISYELCDIRDFNQLKFLFSNYNFSYIYHAAAYKHVPIVESNIVAGVNNNVFGTENLAILAGEHRVKKFVLVSTDKAVRPTNVMGASKRFAELIVGALSFKYPNTVYSIVRFGNVIGSSGSVIPVFHDQIIKGGPVTVTHKEITRYFMSIKEASDLVIFAGNLAMGGETFILDMGKPVKIYDLAKKMINQYGKQIKTVENQDGIEIVFTGLRPGEKLFEELLVDNKAVPTRHPKIFKANEAHINPDILIESLHTLKKAVLANDSKSILNQFRLVVEGFHYEDKV